LQLEELRERHKQKEEKITGMVRKTVAMINQQTANIQRRAETCHDKLKRAADQ
jgi:hypothetical protein